MFDDLIRAWDGEEVVVRFDPTADAWMLVGVHSTVLGPAFGGTRVKVYGAPVEALADVLRLSSAMTSKNALAGLPFGGGKAVIAVPGIPDGEERRRLLLGYGRLVGSLGGTYRTACDMNTRAEDMDVVGEATPYVFGRTPAAGGSGDSGPSTAIGVFHGIRACVGHVFGSSDLTGCRVLVQGVGAVGGVLAERLSATGAEVLVGDIDRGRAEAAVRRGIASATVEPDEVIGTSCDVLSPCAAGGVLSAETIPRLRCRIVAGAANNQLTEAADAERLRAAGIAYVPDYAINSGGVLHLAGLEALGWSRGELEARLEGVGDTVVRILESAGSADVTTLEAAERIVRRRLDARDPAA